jgi:uncharacterized phage-associated protein
MLYHFDVRKATEAAAVLLKFDNGKMEYLRLLKLLYIADRESIAETGCPISLSRAVAMDYGPLSSEVYDLIKGERSDESEWSRFIQAHGHNLELLDDPGRGSLSKYEIAKLNEVSRKYEHLTEWQIVEQTHQFQEWIDNRPMPGSSKSIPIESILDAVGMSQQKEEIMADLQEKAVYDQFFARSAE